MTLKSALEQLMFAFSTVHLSNAGGGHLLRCLAGEAVNYYGTTVSSNVQYCIWLEGDVITSTCAMSTHQVYADRYLELLDAPVELSAIDHASGFQLSVQMISSEVAPYACLVYHDPPPAPLTIEELQEQFGGPYTECTQSQVMRSE